MWVLGDFCWFMLVGGGRLYVVDNFMVKCFVEKMRFFLVYDCVMRCL